LSSEIILDVSELEAPHPLKEGVKAIRALKKDETLVFIHRMRPCRLFDQIDHYKLSYTILKEEANYFEMRIFH
jgi:hypothetical protein